MKITDEKIYCKHGDRLVIIEKYDDFTYNFIEKLSFKCICELNHQNFDAQINHLVLFILILIRTIITGIVFQ